MSDALISPPPADAPSVFVKTFGCQMNVYDSDRMVSLLVDDGYQTAKDLTHADVILINTCSIREKSENKVLSLLGQLKPLKDRYPNKVIGITGCVGQRMGRTLLQKVPHLDLVMGPDSVDRVATIVKSVREEGKRVLEAKFDEEKRRYTQHTVVKKARPSEYLTIMKGCDHFCTYCIVPFVRGREKSRAIAEIVSDVTQFAKLGTKEIVFLGQNINTYGKGSPENLAILIEQTNRIDGIERIRYVTSHPRDLGQDLIDQFGTIEKLCPNLHLPFQSGSDAVLKRMSRLYTQAEYLSKVDRLRKACPDIALTADIIVGFPGETDEDFEATMKVLREVRFSLVYMFKYSERPGTRAAAYVDEVPEKVKEERHAIASAFVNKDIEDQNKTYVGKIEPILIESIDKQKRYYSGRSPHNKMVHVLNAGEACLGKIINVEITESNGSNLRGYYVDAPRTDRDRARSAEATLSAPVCPA